ncbi:T9SS type A sorting domain-containing protein [Hymenobacter antarcticus]
MTRHLRLGLGLLLAAAGAILSPTLHAQTAPAFDRVEYFLDSDPGFGLGTAVTLPATPGTNLAALPFSLSLAAVTPGFHSLGIRSRAGANNWSQTQRQILYKEPATSTAAAPGLAGAEYFIDTDPGYGAGTVIAITGGGTNAAGVAFTASLGSVAPGFHSLSVRSRDANGGWSQTYRQIFYVEPVATNAPPANLAAVEYFVDIDPGYGLGSSAAITGGGTNATGVAFSVGLGSLAVGFHTLYYRVRDVAGKYSQTQNRAFYVDDPTVAAIPNLNKAEYYFDTDPGYGLGANVPIPTPATNLTNLNLLADASALTDGQHRLFVRVRDASGRWSQVLSRAFAKSGCNNSPNFAAGQPAASYTGSGITATAVEQMYNGSAVTGGSSTFFNNFHAQVDLGATTLRTISEVQYALQNVNGTAVNYTVFVETSANLSTWSVVDTYAATLSANQTAPINVTRTLATVQNNVRGIRLRMTLPTVAQGIRLTNAGVFFFPVTCPVPVISGFTPASGPAGTVVTVTGTNLDGATAVTFNGTAAGAITNNTVNGFTVAAPAGGTDGQICVTTPGGTACSAASYLYPQAIATGTISPGTYCTGSTITVPFSTNTSLYGAGNAFNFQLSDASGVFAANAPLLGTLQSISANGGVLTGILPQATPAGSGYRVRVVASNPATTGTDNGVNLTINTTPVSQATGPASVANGAAIALGVTPIYTGATYAWSGPGGFTSTLQSPTTSTTTAGVARYNLTVTLGTCTSSSFVDVNVLTSTDPILALTTFSGSLCLGAARSISFAVSGNPFPAGNTITAQLSDASGSFAAPVAIGSTSFSGQGNGSLTATIPGTTPLGSGYRIRLVGSNPGTIVSNDNGSNIILNAVPTVAVTSNSPVAQGGTIVLNGGPAVAGNGYSWTAQYTAGGSATVGSTQNLSLTNATPAQSGNYTLTITNAAGCTASATVAVSVTPTVPVTTLALTAFAGPLCAGSSFTVSYTAGGPSFGTGNTISAVLSDAGGSFVASTVIGTVSTTAATAGSFSVTLPAGTVAGSGYRIRLESSSPVIISNDNGSNLTITNLSTASAGSNSPVTAGSSISLTATGISGATYAWTGPNGYTATGPNQSIGSATAANAGPYSVLISLNGCSTTVSTTVVVNAAPTVASIQTSAITGSYCAGTPISVPFTASNFTAGNVFTAQLSNASGSFGSPVSIGTLTGVSTGNIAGLLPAGTAAGTGYRIRVVGSQPTTIGADNGSNLTITAAGVFTWLGTVSTNWYTAANWSCNQVPDSTSTTLIPAGMGNYPALSTAAVIIRNLTVTSGATVSTSGNLRLKGNLLNNGTLNTASASLFCAGTTAQTLGGSGPLRFLNLTVANPAGVTLQAPLGLRRVLRLAIGNLASNGNLTLESDASGTAMVLNPAGGGLVTGAATAQRYVSPALNAGLGYRHFASPVAGATVADLRGPGFPAPVVNPAYNTAPDPFVVTPFPTVFTYGEQRLTTTGNSTFDFGWQSPALGDPLAAGQGYTVNLAPATLSLTGTLRTGNQPVTLTRGATANSGWQLLGNPYPAPLNWDNLARPTGMNNALYTFQSSGQYAGSYVSYVNNVGPAGANLVASGQAFFGRVGLPATVTLTFTDAARETVYSSPVQNRGTAETRPLLELELKAPTAGTLPDVLYVYQEAGATAAFDSYYDALKVILNGGQQPTLYQQAGPESLSIQGLPVGNQSQALPLGVNAPTAGTFTFTPQRLDNFPPATTLFLEDRQTGTWHNLRTGAYTATLAQGLSTARFVLHLNAQGPLATTNARLFAEVQVYPNPVPNAAVAHVIVAGQAPALAQAQLTLLNSLGQRVYAAAHPTAQAGSVRFDVPTTGLAAGVYTVRVTTATGTITRKIMLN